MTLPASNKQVGQYGQMCLSKKEPKFSSMSYRKYLTFLVISTPHFFKTNKEYHRISNTSDPPQWMGNEQHQLGYS